MSEELAVKLEQLAGLEQQWVDAVSRGEVDDVEEEVAGLLHIIRASLEAADLVRHSRAGLTSEQTAVIEQLLGGVEARVASIELKLLNLVLKAHGVEPGSVLEAEAALSDGARIFYFSEMDDQPMEVFSVEDLRGYSSDRLLMLDRDIEAPEQQRPRG